MPIRSPAGFTRAPARNLRNKRCSGKRQCNARGHETHALVNARGLQGPHEMTRLTHAATTAAREWCGTNPQRYSLPSPERDATLTTSGGGDGGICFNRRTIAPSRPGGSRIAVTVCAILFSNLGVSGSMVIGKICRVPLFSPTSRPLLQEKLVTSN